MIQPIIKEIPPSGVIIPTKVNAGNNIASKYKEPLNRMIPAIKNRDERMMKLL